MLKSKVYNYMIFLLRDSKSGNTDFCTLLPYTAPNCFFTSFTQKTYKLLLKKLGTGIKTCFHSDIGILK